MALNKKFFPKAAAADAVFTPSEHFNTVLYTGNGSTQRIGGYINRGAVFNGSSSRVDLGKIDAFPDDVSISVWVRLGDTTTTNTLRILSLNAVSSGWAGTLSVRYKPSNGLFSVGIGDGQSTDTTVLSHTNTLTQGVWYNIIVTRNNTTNVTKLYIGGTEVDSETVSATPVVQSNAISVIGNQAQNYAPTTWKGSVDQVRFFNKELSSTEVTTLSNETHASTTIETTDIFNDNSGVALYQLDGNANDTGIIGEDIDSGQSAVFSGDGGYVTIPATATTPIDFSSEDFTISLFAKPHNLSEATQFISKWSTGSQNQRSMYFGQHTTGAVRVNEKGSSSASYYSTGTLTENKWNHIAYVRTGTQVILYLNGVLDSTHNTSLNIGNGVTQDIYLGRVEGSGSADMYDGELDEVRMYSTALSASDISNLALNTNAPTANLAAHYKLDGDATDETGNYNGTATSITYSDPAETPSTEYNGTASNVTYQEATKFSPDLVWIKGRSGGSPLHNWLTDSVRGEHAVISSNLTNAEDTNTSYNLDSFDSNGFTLIGNSVGTNGSGVTYAAWCFNAGDTTTTIAANTVGNTIASTVKANQDAGFSIVTYTGNGTSGATIGHGLSSPPELIITKNRDEAQAWIINADAIGKANIFTFSNGAVLSRPNQYYYAWDSSTITTGSDIHTNGSSDKIVTYCFHSVDNYQKVGSYSSTGVTGAGSHIEVGFEPAFLLIKSSSHLEDWYIFDNKRINLNGNKDGLLFANNSNAENTGYERLQFTETGWYWETAYGGNSSGYDYIYLAIAADPDITTPTVENSFDVVTYTGNGGTQEIATDFKPDLVWVKVRTNTYSHTLSDSVRGDNKALISDGSNSEYTDSDFSISSNGFSMSGNGVMARNVSGQDYVAWCWKAGDHDDNLPQINTEGTIDSIVSVNAEAGFSICKFRSHATNATAFSFGHGLSSAPELVIIKETDGAVGWHVYVSSLGQQSYLQLQSSAAAITGNTNIWNNTAPSSTVFNMKTGYAITNDADVIAYCFHSVTGYQKIGSYTGTGTTGNKQTIGFRPRFLLSKRTSSASDWYMIDSVRNTSNPRNNFLNANTSDAEYTPGYGVNFEDDGFSFISTDLNGTNQTWIYLAIK